MAVKKETAWAKAVNASEGQPLRFVTVEHRINNDEDQATQRKWHNLDPDKETPADLELFYVTDRGTSHDYDDYWIVSFQLHSNDYYKTVEPFICNLTDGDQGKVITVTIKDGSVEIKTPAGQDKTSQLEKNALVEN